MLLVSSGQRLEMPLNILQDTGQPPTIKNDLAQNVTSVQVEKSCFGLLREGQENMGSIFHFGHLFSSYVREK